MLDVGCWMLDVGCWMLDVGCWMLGAVLAKKISPARPGRFVITNRGYNHYYLRCLNTGEQVLVSKSRVREDFDIAN
jgi:hypothetical protein